MYPPLSFSLPGWSSIGQEKDKNKKDGEIGNILGKDIILKYMVHDASTLHASALLLSGPY